MKITKQGLFNFIDAAGRVVDAAASGDQILVDSSIKNKRLDLCKICEHNVANQCQICECLIRAKAMLVTENCPKGKW
jgi:hypothetical protein